MHLIDSGILGIAVSSGAGPLPAAAAAPAAAVEVAEEFLDCSSELDVDDAVEDSVDAEVEQVKAVRDVYGQVQTHKGGPVLLRDDVILGMDCE